MLEAQLKQNGILKKLFEAIKDLLTQANVECTSSGIQLFTIDEQHISIVEFLLRCDGFENFRCDRTVTLGIQLESLMKILKCGSNEDSVVLKADDNGDTLSLVFESEKKDKISEFDLKLISINSQSLQMQDNPYDATVTMSSAELVRICRDLKSLSDSVVISVSKEAIKFSIEGDIGNASIYVKPVTAADSTDSVRTSIHLNTPVSCSLSLKHVSLYTKAAPLSDTVKISLSNQYPAIFEFFLEGIGYLKYYLAPKIDAEE